MAGNTLAWHRALSALQWGTNTEAARRGWPETFTPEQISRLQYPNDRTAQLELVSAMLADFEGGWLADSAKDVVTFSMWTSGKTPPWWGYCEEGPYNGGGHVEIRNPRPMISPHDALDWLENNGENPSDHILAWADAVGSATEAISALVGVAGADAGPHLQAMRDDWIESKPVYVKDGELREIFHGTHTEWAAIYSAMENDILQGRLNAEVAVKKGDDFEVIENITKRMEIRNGWLGGGWVRYTIKTDDAAAWFKSKYEIPADSMLGRLFGGARSQLGEILSAPVLTDAKAVRESPSPRKVYKKSAAIDALSNYVNEPSRLESLFSNASKTPELQACKIDKRGWDLKLLFDYLSRHGYLKREHQSKAGENAFRKLLGI